MGPFGKSTAIEQAGISRSQDLSIAVLAFKNLSGDPSQDYFSDAIAEDITTELSRFSELFVISRKSAFSYKGQSKTAKAIGQDLGVRYLLEGSVQRLGDRLRVTVQLIDTSRDSHGDREVLRPRYSGLLPYSPPTWSVTRASWARTRRRPWRRSKPTAPS